MRKRVILGDIHGHYDTFLKIYTKECPEDIILLGDYLDSFSKSSKECVECLNNILEIKKKHSSGEFIMLLGNHDLHYVLPGEKYSGYKLDTQVAVYNTLIDNILNGNITIIYIDNINKILFSHAGVSNVWLQDNNIKNLEDINNISSILDLNSLRFTGCNMYGDDITNGPVWIRPHSLLKAMPEGWFQIVGHTQTGKPLEYPNLLVVDTLPNYYIVQELEDNGKLIRTNIVQLI